MRSCGLARSACVVCLLASCSSNPATNPSPDGGGAPDGSAGSDGAQPSDAAGLAADGALAGDGAGPLVDGGPTCIPSSGPSMTQLSCDFLQLAVLHHTGAPSELVLTGRLFVAGGPSSSCVVVDGVDVLSGTTVVQHLGGGTHDLLDGSERELARGVPVADVESRCASDDPAQRFDMYGIAVTGRIDGGSFTASCAQAQGGGQWPPALRLTCHDNVEGPAEGGSAAVSTSTLMGTPFSQATLYGASPHGVGGALTTVDGTVHFIGKRSPFDPGPPIAAFDSTGWMGSVSETTLPAIQSLLSLFVGQDALGASLCPGAGLMPTPPVFLARVKGMGAHGAFSTEIFVSLCTRSTH